MISYRPEGYTAVTPWIISKDTARLIDFVKAAFGAAELARIPSASGGIDHAEVRIGDGIVMMFDSRPGWPNTPAFIRLYVEDADAAFAAAVEAGASVITHVTHLAFGDKVGRVRDPLGNVWWLQTHVEDVTPGELAKRWTDSRWAAAMAYVQNSLTEALAD